MHWTPLCIIRERFSEVFPWILEFSKEQKSQIPKRYLGKLFVLTYIVCLLYYIYTFV